MRIAAVKDSSSRNSRGGGKLYHVMGDRGVSACGEWPMCEDMGYPLNQIPEILRCQRKGCRELWQPADPQAEVSQK